MNSRIQPYRRRIGGAWRIRRLLARLSVVPTAMLAMMLGSLAVLGLGETGLGDWLLDIPAVPRSATAGLVSARFPVCGDGARVTCVVDGDTFWLDGSKIRIADINTPETSAPQCAREADLGRQATMRLAQLLSAGPFSLAAIDRDEDRYGRKLRIIERDGRSLGAQLVAEGLAHDWGGSRRGWC